MMQTYSVDAAPRFPELKLSIKRTHRRSKGTVVPPDVTQTRRAFISPVEKRSVSYKNSIAHILKMFPR